MTEEEKEKLIPPMKGLSDAQVEERAAKGLNNKASDCTGKTIKQIIISNVFTYFNLIFLILVILLCIAGSFRNLTFLPVIIGNTLIGIFQEIRAKKTLEKMSILNAPHAIVIRNGIEKQILSEELVKDDIIRLSASDQICADAVVVQGAIQVNESLLTGESDEIDKKSGSSLMSGSFVTAGQCYARLVNVGDEAYVAKLNAQAKAMGEGEQSEMIRSINRIVMAIGITVIPIGAALFAQGYFINGEGVQKSIVSMVAAIIGMIPEGLYLLTTVALALSTIKLASQKVLLHDMKSIEALARVDVLCVDKTGTITSGEPKVTDMIPAEGISEEELLGFAYALERKSEHPLAHAILQEAQERRLDAEEVEDFQAVPGNGLSAVLAGTTIYGGNKKFIQTKTSVDAGMLKKAEDLAAEGKTPLFFAKEDQLIGIIAVADVIKEDSPKAVKELQNMGIHVVMLTGDNERTAKAIGRQAGVDEVIADVLPDGKEAVIRKLKKKGKVAMVGDGINDAPALTRADMGIAIGAGTDIAIDAADVVLMKSRLSDVPAAIRMSKATLRNIHENLFWAFFYNVIGIPLAAGIWYPIFGWKLNPMFGAAAMSLSSFCVVTNALRLNWFKMYDASKDKKIKSKVKEIEEEKTMTIEGMMCGHCEATVKKTLEAIEGVEAAEVSHENGTAVVTLAAEVADEVLKKAVEDKDYKVTGIE